MHVDRRVVGGWVMRGWVMRWCDMSLSMPMRLGWLCMPMLQMNLIIDMHWYRRMDGWVDW